MALRPYQVEVKTDIYQAWDDGYKNVLAVMPTGGGKTRIFCDIATEQAHTFGLPTAIEVHRKELVQQIALTLAELEIPHNIIAPRPTIIGITAAERKLFGKQFYDYRAPISIVSVDTLNARILKHEKWAKAVQLWIVDEAAHLLKKNKWGRSVEYFPKAKGLGVTATPQRLDKRGLGRHADGVFDKMVLGPTTKWLIDSGYLNKYKIVVPKGDYQEHLRSASEGHDYTRQAMAQASEKSKIVGDVVDNYQRFAPGKQCIVFADSIAAGRRMEQEFNERGIPAKLLTGETNDSERLQGLIDFRSKDVKVLINVDLFDEGLDVPGIECVSMARPTMSLAKFLQMIGRGLRPSPDFTIIIDHVGNIKEHGLPDSHRNWTLDRIIKRRDKVNLIRFCANPMCASPYDRLEHVCPYCGLEVQRPGPSEGGGRVPLELVDGDLVLLDPETLRQLEVNTHLESPLVVGKRVSGAMGGVLGVKAMEQQRERIRVRDQLYEAIAQWAGKMKYQGYSDRKINKYFYIHWNMTITQAVSQKKADMLRTLEIMQNEI